MRQQQSDVAGGPRHMAFTLLTEPHGALAYLAAASHDLRDPLQIITSYIDLLAESVYGPVNSEQHGCLARVRCQVEHVSRIVDSILTLARAEGGPALEPSDVAVPELLAEVHGLLEPLAAAGGVSLATDCGSAPTALRGERTAVVRVLTNLVGNAVKFTPRGGRVLLSAIALPGAVELRVSDTGPGIASSRLDEIFEPFVRLRVGEDLEGREFRGVGLGLSIARDLIRLLGGELVVQSVVGSGSTFVVRLPASCQPAQATAGVPVPKAA
jgi:signal transduction histidine kinase